LPESLGLAASSIYIITLLIITLLFVKGNDFKRLGEFTATLLSICCMALLGFVDDVLDIKWRYKIWLPSVASLPLLILYKMTGGNTFVIIPKFIAKFLDKNELLDLGYVYYLYMSMSITFCTHSINILAGVNGVEVGQALVIAVFSIIHNLICIVNSYKVDSHSFSLICLVPFTFVCLALLKHNWFPARIFVGDTFCYFAGMTLAAACILGHYSKTMLFFLVPQIINFLISLPQLFKLIPCPRHRLPKINLIDGMLYPSSFSLTPENVKTNQFILKIFKILKIISIQKEEEELIVSNFTILNMILVWVGPVKEVHLAIIFLFLQTAFCSIALLGRHYFANFLFK
jgi:UDP-N-acetylglucosamine--dolichyl-phosphate N-acetylglucosaminephosphotransferase